MTAGELKGILAVVPDHYVMKLKCSEDRASEEIRSNELVDVESDMEYEICTVSSDLPF